MLYCGQDADAVAVRMSHGVDLPEKIGKYEILGIAGRGAMGVVYHGHDPFFDREVAIKTTQQLAGNDDEHRMARRMLFNEARAARELDHGAILQVFDAGEHEGEPYVVMEYVPDATTLREFCRPDNLLPLERAVEVIYICAKALDYAHRRGVIHRDIKASNIMLTRDGRVKIGDFGIARMDSVETTEILGKVGSPRYMSPEQLTEKPLTAQTDLYSLGVVLYELLAGRPAFEGKSFADLARRILSGTTQPVATWRPEVPAALDDVVRQAIARAPEHRYASGMDMAADLAAVYGSLEREPEQLAPDTRFEMARDLHFFNDFSDDELREVVNACQWRRFAFGERIIREGNMEHAFYVLVNGDVSVSKGGQRVATLSVGSCFGEMGFLARTTRTASVHARDDVIVITANADMLARLPTTVQLRFNQAMVQTLVDRLASTTERLSKFLP